MDVDSCGLRRSTDPPFASRNRCAIRRTTTHARSTRCSRRSRLSVFRSDIRLPRAASVRPKLGMWSCCRKCCRVRRSCRNSHREAAYDFRRYGREVHQGALISCDPDDEVRRCGDWCIDICRPQSLDLGDSRQQILSPGTSLGLAGDTWSPIAGRLIPEIGISNLARPTIVAAVEGNGSSLDQKVSSSVFATDHSTL